MSWLKRVWKRTFLKQKIYWLLFSIFVKWFVHDVIDFFSIFLIYLLNSIDYRVVGFEVEPKR